MDEDMGEANRSDVVSADTGTGDVTRPGTGWVARNRWGLLVLPLAAALALAGNARRIETYWWENELRVAYTAEPGSSVQLRSGYDDGHQRFPITPTLSLVSIEETTEVTYRGKPQIVLAPTNGRVWKVTIKVEADPNMILGGCHVAITDGSRRWESGLSTTITDAFVIGSTCTPDDQPGPSWMPNSPQPVVDANEVRPAEYTVDNYVVTASDVVPTEVLVWWYEPDYVALRVPPAR